MIAFSFLFNIPFIILQQLSTQWTVTFVLLAGLTFFLLIYIYLIKEKNKEYKSAFFKQQTSARVLEAYKKQSVILQNQLDSLQNNNGIDNTEINMLRKNIVGFEKKTSDMHLQIIRLKNEKQQLQENINQLISANQSNEISEYNNKILELREEIIIMDHHLSDCRAMLEDFVEKNKLLGDELQKTLDREKNLESENLKVIRELEEIKSHNVQLSEENDKLNTRILESFQEQDPIREEELIKMNRQLQILQEQLDAEERARLYFEKQIKQILEDYKNSIARL